MRFNIRTFLRRICPVKKDWQIKEGPSHNSKRLRHYSINDIQKIDYEISELPGIPEIISIEKNKSGTFTITSDDRIFEPKRCKVQKSELEDLISKLFDEIKVWKDDYYDTTILDGYGWSLVIIFSDGTKIEYSCINAGPENTYNLDCLLKKCKELFYSTDAMPI